MLRHCAQNNDAQNKKVALCDICYFLWGRISCFLLYFVFYSIGGTCLEVFSMLSFVYHFATLTRVNPNIFTSDKFHSLG